MENLLKPEITSALGWTLLHSLWQGLLLATLYFAVTKLVKSSELKYRFGIASMFIQFITAICSFLNLGDFSNNNELTAKGVLNFFLSQNVAPTKMNLTDTILFFLSTNLTVIVQVWLVGISLFLIKLIFDFWGVNRLKTTGLKQVDNLTLTKFNTLVSSLKITQKIGIFESSQTSSPIVIGNLKPLILLPIGLTSELTINELEAILAHELAHIKRKDFLVNILQSIIEIIFFFNPSIWWISSQVREEREHCCDDFSVSLTGDKLLLVNALAQIESFRINQPLAMAFGKKRMTLLNRVKRILGMNTKENRGIESIVVVTFVSIILGSIIFFKSDKANGQIQNIKLKVENRIRQTSLKKDEQLEAKSFSSIKKDSNVDTTITEEISESFSSGVVYKDNIAYKYFNSNSRRGEFWIDKAGDIYVDGKKYNASPELLAKIKPYLQKMNSLSEEMDVYGKRMDVLGKEMDVYGKKMDQKSTPMNEYGKLMDIQGKLLDEQVKLQTKYSLKASLAELENEKSEKENFEKLEKELEKKVDEISKEMGRLGKEMEKLGKGMENDGKPMEELGKKMEVEGKKMEIIGKKMEVVSREMIKILPDDLKKKIKEIEKGFND